MAVSSGAVGDLSTVSAAFALLLGKPVLGLRPVIILRGLVLAAAILTVFARGARPVALNAVFRLCGGRLKIFIIGEIVDDLVFEFELPRRAAFVVLICRVRGCRDQDGGDKECQGDFHAGAFVRSFE